MCATQVEVSVTSNVGVTQGPHRIIECSSFMIHSPLHSQSRAVHVPCTPLHTSKVTAQLPQSFQMSLKESLSCDAVYYLLKLIEKNAVVVYLSTIMCKIPLHDCNFVCMCMSLYPVSIEILA